MFTLTWQITGITDDSRKVELGYIFVALKGLRYDGHSYIEEAAQKGAVAVISDAIAESPFLPVIQVGNARKALATLLNLFYDNPSRKLKTIGITGTNGKTTTTFMLDGIFQHNEWKTGLIGTVIVKINQNIRRANLTTPCAQELQEAFAEMVRNQVEYVTMEVSSQGLATYRVEGVDFDCGVVTNLTLDHLDCHPTFIHYLDAKKKFLQMLGQDKTVFLNIDDPLVMSMSDQAQAKILTYGLGEQADFQARNLKLADTGASFSFCVNKILENSRGEIISPQTFPIKLRVLGKHNIYNALVATAVAFYEGVRPVTIQSALSSFQAVERRMEMVYDGEVKILDDTALNPASINVVFQAVEQMEYNKLIVVNAIRGNRGVGVNKENATALVSWLKKLNVGKLISTCSVGQVGPYDIVTPEEERAFCEEVASQGIQLNHFLDLHSAIQEASNHLERGDLLLLLGAQGMDDGAKIAMELCKKKSIIMKLATYYSLIGNQQAAALEAF